MIFYEKNLEKTLFHTLFKHSTEFKQGQIFLFLLKFGSMDELPLIGMGTFRVKDKNLLIHAIFQGYRHFDLAENYDNLEIVKEALQFAFSQGLSRSEFWITMKVFFIKNEAHIDRLLEALGLQYFDLLLFHGPFHLFENEDSLFRNWQFICSFQSFKVRRAGVSNFYRPHLERLLLICADHDLPHPFANQIQMSPFVFDEDLLSFCRDADIKIISYSPLGFEYSNMLLHNNFLLQIANSLHVSAAEIALGWLLQKGVYVIPTSSKIEHLAENLKAENVKVHLTPSMIQMINEIHLSFDCQTMFLIDVALSAIEHGNLLTW